MGHRREFEIAFVGLKPGVHEYVYDLDDKFFAEFGEQDFSNAHAHIRMNLDKHPSFLILTFEVGGKVESGCDRCGNNIPFELWDEFEILVKMVVNIIVFGKTRAIKHISEKQAIGKRMTWSTSFLTIQKRVND